MDEQTPTEVLCISICGLYVTLRNAYEAKEYAVYTILGYDLTGKKISLDYG